MTIESTSQVRILRGTGFLLIGIGLSSLGESLPQRERSSKGLMFGDRAGISQVHVRDLAESTCEQMSFCCSIHRRVEGRGCAKFKCRASDRMAYCSRGSSEVTA